MKKFNVYFKIYNPGTDKQFEQAVSGNPYEFPGIADVLEALSATTELNFGLELIGVRVEEIKS